MDGLETIAFTEEGDIATVTLNRPSVGNRINVAFLREFQRVCEYLEDHSQSRIVVLRGAGDDFCMGIDFGDFNPQQPIDIHGFAKWEKMVVLLERLPKVTIALLHGRVVGAGMQLALACDQRIALEGTVFQIPEVHMGFLPGMAVFRLAKYIGLGHAKRLLLTAEEWHASSALEWGIVDRIAADLQEGLNATVASLGPIHVVAVEMARRLLNESFHDTYEDAIGHFLAAQHRCVGQTAFLETLGDKAKT